MFNTTYRLSWLSSLATAALLGLMTLLSGCGGGGASSSNTLPMTVLPTTATIYAYADTQTTLTVRAGKKPFNVYSSNTAIISFNEATMPGGLVPDETIVLQGPTGNYGRVSNVDADTAVTLTVRDAEGVQVTVAVTVKPSSLNNTLTVTGQSATGASQTFLSSGLQGTATVRATTITGGPVSGHKIRFRAVDQGAKFGFICNQSLGDCLVITTDSAGHITEIETTTDRNGDAFAVIKADSFATTQETTISATDQTTGHVLRKQFVIAGTALSVIPASGTWTIGTGVTDPAVPSTAGNGILEGVESMGGCTGAPANGNTNATTGFFIYGGTPPYTITSTQATVGGVSNSSTGTFGGTTTVANSGSQFFVRAMCTAEGVDSIVVMDSAGTVLSTVTFTVDFAW